MIERLGFEKNKRIQREFNNQAITETVGGKTYHYRSLFERNWAKYLQFLKEAGEVQDWEYEPHRFHFHSCTRGPYSYLPDFRVEQVGGGNIWHECKGVLESKDASKYQRMSEQYPDFGIELVMQRLPKTTNAINRLDRIRRKQWVRRVIDASVIFRQIKGII